MEEGGKVYVTWEEMVVSNDKGRRVVHYYLRDAAGAGELAVVGRERSVRHMSYAVPGPFMESLVVKPPHLPPASPPSSSSSSPPHDGVALRWKTRREVIDWLSSFVSGFPIIRMCLVWWQIVFPGEWLSPAFAWLPNERYAGNLFLISAIAWLPNDLCLQSIILDSPLRMFLVGWQIVFPGEWLSPSFAWVPNERYAGNLFLKISAMVPPLL